MLRLERKEPVLALALFIENGGKEGMAIKAELAGQIIAAYMPLLYPERAAEFEKKKLEAQHPGVRVKATPRATPPPPETEDGSPVEDSDD